MDHGRIARTLLGHPTAKKWQFQTLPCYYLRETKTLLTPNEPRAHPVLTNKVQRKLCFGYFFFPPTPRAHPFAPERSEWGKRGSTGAGAQGRKGEHGEKRRARGGNKRSAAPRAYLFAPRAYLFAPVQQPGNNRGTRHMVIFTPLIVSGGKITQKHPRRKTKSRFSPRAEFFRHCVSMWRKSEHGAKTHQQPPKKDVAKWRARGGNKRSAAPSRRHFRHSLAAVGVRL